MSDVEKVSCFPNEGKFVVIPGGAADGDIVRPIGKEGGPYYRYTVPKPTPPPTPAPDTVAVDVPAAYVGAVKAMLANLPA